MSEPRNIRRKSENQISDQLGRIVDSINERMRSATSEREKRSLRNRYDVVANAYNQYVDNIHTSPAWTRALNRHYRETGSLVGIGPVLTNLEVPRSQYARRTNRR